MKANLKILLFMSAQIVGLVKFLFLIQSNLWYLVPFLGCCIGIWYSLSAFIFIVKNAAKLKKLENVIQNFVYLCQRKGLRKDDSRWKEFMDKFSVSPEDFKRNF